MAIRGMNSAASGMQAYLFNLDTIANNLANAGTTAFKRSRVNFEDLYYEQIKFPGAQDSNGKLTPVGTHLGLGTRVASTEYDFSEGSLLTTAQELDVAIIGEGFFQIQDGAEILYTRAGTFTTNADGDVVLASASKGRLLEPSISIPQDTTEIVISGDGTVSVKQAGSSSLSQVGQIQTVRFINAGGLVSRGENLYALTDASGAPLVGNPGVEGRGQVRQGALETSNVEPVRELVNLIKTQRNFELSSQTIQAADQALQLVANLRRF